ncbi:energy transducer TonB [uncultured Akkermansia sp.]|uniref:energy transducer TonB n=1 Tax=uncultured Akkermansia sp. TaxID=512294 RepID=UPI0025940CF3|nr:energy transducer TonB [uncultured Akkermansia sp.]
MWFPSVQGGDVEMTFVSPSEEISLETEEVQTVSVVPVAAPSTVSPIPEIASNEDLLAIKLPENEDCSEMKDFLLDEASSELLPEELAVMRISMNEVKRRQPVKSPVVSPPGRPDPEQNISPDKKVRYKHAPALPNSVNSSKVGKVNAVVKVVVGVTSRGEPSSVNLLQSTGNAELDRLFMRWVRENWTFYPAEKDGVPIASKVVVPVRLNID